MVDLFQLKRIMKYFVSYVFLILWPILGIRMNAEVSGVSREYLAFSLVAVVVSNLKVLYLNTVK